jgi:hypothetical protein
MPKSERLEPKIQLSSHNAKVPIYIGKVYIVLKSGEKVEFVGEVFFDWFPRQIIKVKCEINEAGNDFFKDQFPVIGQHRNVNFNSLTMLFKKSEIRQFKHVA